MNAKILGLWLIVECPYCHAPIVVNKYVKDNTVLELLRTRYETCENCDKSFFIELEDKTLELGV